METEMSNPQHNPLNITPQQHMEAGRAIGRFEDLLDEFKKGSADSFAQFFSEYNNDNGYELLAIFARDLALELEAVFQPEQDPRTIAQQTPHNPNTDQLCEICELTGAEIPAEKDAHGAWLEVVYDSPNVWDIFFVCKNHYEASKNTKECTRKNA